MRRSLWSFAIFGLAVGSLAMVGGTAIGGELGPLAVGYGMLVAITGLYLVAGLAIRERVWRRMPRPMATPTHTDRLAGRRVF
ncbi:MAG TPA: hypothetical protein VFW95_05220 [Candidatus Limnocylindria bacterium]|nr:hypothetical protein [Candidatus Limnocylindria bacterium]